MTPAAEQKRVYVGLSGGVDSSVAALLLQREGYDVVGVFIKGWQPDFLPCTWKEDRQSAMRVAATLGIPFRTIDLSLEYKREVFDRMTAGYEHGETPNPDVWCNEKIKFGLFLEHALRDGATHVATGHYARRVDDSSGVAHLHLSEDTEKDQTYFLGRISQDALQHALFPIGHLTKTMVRDIARDAGLPTAGRKDSQGLCFVGMLDMKDFLRASIPHERGAVTNVDGQVIGHHDGVGLYTLGERHGFEVSGASTDRSPVFVIAKNVATNTLVVGPKSDRQTSNTVVIRDLRKLGSKSWLQGMSYDVRFRYRQSLVNARITAQSDEMCTVQFDTAQERPAAGQLLVLYDAGECIGSGIIVS